MLSFETLNELTLKVTCTGRDVLFTKAGSFIAGDSPTKNYKFEKLLLGPEGGFGRALMGSLMRRVSGENLPLMKVMMDGDSVTYYANAGQHVVIYRLEDGETISVESENILAFTQDCDYNVRFLGSGIFSQKGLATSTLTGKGKNAYVAVLSDGKRVSGVKLKSGTELPLDGLFCLRDSVSLAALLPDLAMEDGHIATDRSMKTNLPGCFAAGDCTGRPYQYVKAAGEGNVAAHSAIAYLAGKQ